MPRTVSSTASGSSTKTSANVIKPQFNDPSGPSLVLLPSDQPGRPICGVADA
jgi:hypothetical protein